MRQALNKKSDNVIKASRQLERWFSSLSIDELEMRWINFHDMEDEVKKPQEIIHRARSVQKRSYSLIQRLAEVSWKATVWWLEWLLVEQKDPGSVQALCNCFFLAVVCTACKVNKLRALELKLSSYWTFIKPSLLSVFVPGLRFKSKPVSNFRHRP